MAGLPYIQIEKRVTDAPQSTVSGGEVRSAFGALADGLDSIASGLKRREAEQESFRVEEAALRGQGAVYTDDEGTIKFTPRPVTSREDMAYNRAARQATLAAIDDDARARLQQMRIDAGGDVSKFDAAGRVFIDAMVGKQDDLMKGPVKQGLESYYKQIRTGIVEES
jgi:hypothetical protein